VELTLGVQIPCRSRASYTQSYRRFKPIRHCAQRSVLVTFLFANPYVA
jgi:hypothetical protein